eukprot:m.158569 g.158569  ORF g.158569 m.158569 type:complete len:1036 (-) comp9830_c0_seq1:3607-6714(-)
MRSAAPSASQPRPRSCSCVRGKKRVRGALERLPVKAAASQEPTKADEDELLQQLVEAIEGYRGPPGATPLTILSAAGDRVSSALGLRSFASAGHGDVLAFAARHLPALGRTTALDDAREFAPAFRAQCSEAGLQGAAADAALSRQFGLEPTLAGKAQPDARPRRPLVFAHAMAGLDCGAGATHAKAGLLGDVSESRALAVLEQAPVMANLHQWASWDLVFEPQHGPLSQFLAVAAKHVDWQACVCQPNAVYKLPAAFSRDEFAAALDAYEGATALGHAIACAIEAGNAARADELRPLVTSLAERAASDELEFPRFAAFIADAALLVPTEFQALLHRIFIEPLPHAMSLEQLAALHETMPVTAQRILLCASIRAGSKDRVDDFLNGTGTTTARAARPAAPILVIEQPVDAMPEDGPTAMDQEGGAPTDVPDGSAGQVQPGHATASMRTDAAAPGESGAAVLTDTRELACAAVIDDLRLNRFGLGREKSDLLEETTRMLANSLARLSEELYAEDSHFLLELVQNADDNRYEAGVAPALRFYLQPGMLVIQNNETGFEDVNVRALCNVASSTKDRSGDQGYIGAKGIGFKSVFKVTSAPAIHSNGFHFKFDRSIPVEGGHAGLSYVLPHHVASDQYPNVALTADWATSIVLPMDERKLREQSQQLLRLDPSILLFLKKISVMQFVDARAAKLRTRRIARARLPHGIVELTCASDHEAAAEQIRIRTAYLVVGAEYSPTVARNKHKVEKTTLSLAFPRHPDGLVQPFPARDQFCFAYLPVKRYGLRFIVQADFVVTSSREEVLAQDPWNCEILDRIAPVFVQALHRFKEECQLDTRVTPVDVVKAFLPFIPLENQCTGFFESLPRQLLQTLRQEECLIASDGSWARPDELVASSDQTLIAMLRADGILESIGKKLVHPDVAAVLSPALASALEVGAIDGDLLLCVLESRGSTEPSAFGTWLRAFAAVHAQTSPAERVRLAERLARMAVFPAERKRIVRADGLYLPVGSKAAWLPASLRKRVQILHSGIFDALDPKHRPL